MREVKNRSDVNVEEMTLEQQIRYLAEKLWESTNEWIIAKGAQDDAELASMYRMAYEMTVTSECK